MPTYHYRCASCEQHIEVVQSMTDDPITECGACGGNMQKVLRPVGIVLKGSGFYRTDNRAGAKSTAKSSEGSQKSEKSEKSEKRAESASSSKDSGSSKDSSGSSGSGSTKAADAKSA